MSPLLGFFNSPHLLSDLVVEGNVLSKLRSPLKQKLYMLLVSEESDKKT